MVTCQTLRNIASRLVLGTVVAAMLSGPAAAKEVQITFSMRSGDRVEVANYENLLKLFEQKNPGIKVTFQNIPDGYEDKITTMLATGTSPDVIWYGGVNSAPLIRQGAFENLLPLIKADPSFDLDDFFAPGIKPFYYKGGLYGIPRDLSPLVLYYNADMFDQAGLADPNTLDAKDQWTWDNFLTAARKLTRGDGKSKVFGFDTDIWWGLWFPWVLTNGGELFSDDYKDALFDKPKAVAGLQFMADLMNVHRVAPRPKDHGSLGFEHWAALAQGRAAMYPTGRWAVPGYRDEIKGFAWDVAQMPYKERKATAMFVGIYAIPKTSKHKTEAFQLLKWLISADAQAIIARSGQAMPSRRSLAASKDFLDAKPPKHNDVFIKAAGVGYLEPIFPTFDRVSGATWSEFEMALNGEQTFLQAVTKVMPEVNRLMAQQDKK